MPDATIPFNRSWLRAEDFDSVGEALRSGHLSGDGAFTRACHALLESSVGVPKALLTTSCTDALEMSAILLDIGPGDEVIVPSYTFVSSINAFVLRGARPVFIDVRPDTLNLDESALRSKIGPRTKAIVVVHYAGVGCEMDQIMKIAGECGVPVVEDNAHGLFGKYKGRYLGTFAPLATQSFHETKNFTSGEGGALLINDPALIERAEIIREKGTNRSRFFRGQVDKYTWVDLGSSFLPSELNAALLLSQLRAREVIQGARARVFGFYEEHLRDWAAAHRVKLPTVPAHCDQAFHMFYLLMPDLGARTRFIAHLKQAGIMAVFHYVPLHLSGMGVKFGGKVGDCPVTEDVSDRLVRLPFYGGLTSEDLRRVVDAVLAFGA